MTIDLADTTQLAATVKHDRLLADAGAHLLALNARLIWLGRKQEQLRRGSNGHEKARLEIARLIQLAGALRAAMAGNRVTLILQAANKREARALELIDKLGER